MEASLETQRPVSILCTASSLGLGFSVAGAWCIDSGAALCMALRGLRVYALCQGGDPATDLRDLGMFSVLQLVYLVCKHGGSCLNVEIEWNCAGSALCVALHEYIHTF
jgi:hypothetical protein